MGNAVHYYDIWNTYQIHVNKTKISQMTPKAQYMREKNDKLNFTKIKIFYSLEDTIKKIKRQEATDCKAYI